VNGFAVPAVPPAPGYGPSLPDVKARIHRRLVEQELEIGANEASVRSTLAALAADEAPLLAGEALDALVEELAAEALGLGPLEPLLADPEVTETMIVGSGRVYAERRGIIESTDMVLPGTVVLRIVERILAPLGLRLDRSSPMVDARLADGTRVHAVVPPLAIDGPCVTIRRFTPRSFAVEDFDVSWAAAEFLRGAVQRKLTVVVSGGTSTGKTTMLNALAGAIERGERVVTIEETAELALGLPHVVRLEARPANAEGIGAVGVRELVRAALRMRPDRLILGEVRGAEALDMLQAMNTGHDGSLCSVHANSAADALTRIVTLAMFAGVGLPVDALRSQLLSAVDLVVHMARRDGRRVVETIGEVCAPERGGLEIRPRFDRSVGGLVEVATPGRVLLPRARGIDPADGVAR
jgi:pilus assembly protein CpaF